MNWILNRAVLFISSLPDSSDNRSFCLGCQESGSAVVGDSACSLLLILAAVVKLTTKTHK